MSDVLLIDDSGPVWTFTLNRPDALNAFDEELHAAFGAAWMKVEASHDVRAVILTGAGRAFSAGGSIDDFTLFKNDFAARSHTMRQARRIVDELINVYVPVIAAVNGPAVGLGATLASLCDIVFVADNTFLQDPHVAVALVAGDGGAVTWPLSIGLHRTKQYLLTGEKMPAATAVELGLANFAVPADKLMDEARAFAERFVKLPPQSVQQTKAVLNQHLRAAAVATLGYGLAAESQSHDTVEYAAVPAQFAKRK